MGGVGTVYGRTLTYPLTAAVSIPGEPGRHVFRDRTRKRFYKRNVRSGGRTRVLDDVKCEAITY